MKNCDEMVKSLFERRECYAAEQKRKRKLALRVAGSACCVCLIALFGFGIGQKQTTPKQTAADAVYPSIQDYFDENNSSSADEPAQSNKIVINQISVLSGDKMDICLLEEDFVEMSRTEMVAYYGVNYIPQLPADICAWQDERSGIYMRDGEVYWDADILNFSNGDFTRRVHLEVGKVSDISRDYFYLEATQEKSVINNLEVFIGRTEDGYYYADFAHQGVNFALDAKGVTEDEFLAILSSLIQ